LGYFSNTGLMAKYQAKEKATQQLLHGRMKDQNEIRLENSLSLKA